MNLRSQAASLFPSLRRAQSERLLALEEPQVPASSGGDGLDDFRATKRKLIAWRDDVHDRLRGQRPKSPTLAVRVGSSEFGGDDREHTASARSRLYQTRDLWTLLTLNLPNQELVIVHEMLDPDILYYYLRMGVAEGRPDIRNRLGRLRTVLLPPHRPQLARQAPTHHNLAIRLMGHVSCQNAVTAHIKQHKRVSSSPPILSLYQNSPRMEGIAKILELDALTTTVPLLWLGSKHGSRQMFSEANVPHPFGMCEPVTTYQTLAEALCAMTHKRPQVQRWMIKITDGTASGNGNAQLNLADVKRPLQSLAEALLLLQKRLKVPTHLGRFNQELSERGAILEAFIASPEGSRTTSPSAQGVIEHDGTVHVVSSHEQVLDAATSQSYEGCSYPALAAYRAEIIRYTRQIGERLHAHGARGHFAVDYLAVQSPEKTGKWDVSAIEINLRETGTTPPFMMMNLLCGGHRDATGQWYDAIGQAKYYVASDSIYKQNLKGVHPQTVIDAVAKAGLEFSPQRTSRRAPMTGVVLTLLPGVRTDGKIGCICIANREQDARTMQADLERCLEKVREAALETTTSVSAPPEGRAGVRLQTLETGQAGSVVNEARRRRPPQPSAHP